MTELEKIEETARLNSEQKSLELLFEYTKFHIGVYLTLTTAYVAAANIKVNGKALFEFELCYVLMAIMCFMFAGLAGGVIASSLTQTEAKNSRIFLDSEIGPWDFHWLRMKAKKWTWLEHTSFWLGLVFAIVSVINNYFVS